MTILELLDYAGVAVFAATGALSASRKQLDVIGFLFLAAATGIGGGTFRDVILDAGPVFWVAKPTYLIVCVCVGLLFFFTAHLFESRYRLLLWFDAIGLSAYSVMGAAKGLAATGSPTVAITTGVMTASAGGILRDLLSGEPSVLLRPEIYVTAALTGAAAFTAATAAGAPLLIASAIGVLSALVVRSGALRYGWRIPAYKCRPGRHPDDVT
ncbi:MAG TPA: trimeric intracellular cation channel family protein [Mycoplana sp.]|nr:trimeric intracellular cation channel family protein [Mycoplana sp.]